MPIRAKVESANAVMHEGKLFGHNLVIAAAAAEGGVLDTGAALVAGGSSERYQISLVMQLDDVDCLDPTPACSSKTEGSGAPPGVAGFDGVKRYLRLTWDAVDLAAGKKISIALARKNGAVPARVRVSVKAQPKNAPPEPSFTQALSF